MKLKEMLTEEGKKELESVMFQYGDVIGEEIFINTRLHGDGTVKDNKTLYVGEC